MTRGEKGFSYPLLLLVLAIMGLSAQGALVLASRLKRVDQEKELLFRGEAYRRAIRSYYEAGPPGRRSYPASLGDLLLDPRDARRRHLRKPYPDPVSGRPWNLIFETKGGIIGVSSVSLEKPLKQTGFPGGEEEFGGADSYSRWKFEIIPR